MKYSGSDMRSDSAALAALARARDLLLDPRPAHLDTFAAEVGLAMEGMRTAPATRYTAALARQIRVLFEQAGRLRLGAAAVGVETPGYTSTGLPHASTVPPRVAISG